MPKRTHVVYKSGTAKVRRKKAVVIEDASDLSDPEKSNDDEVVLNKEKKKFQFIKSDQNNEINRLLVHNSSTVIFSADHNVLPAFNVCVWPEDNDILTCYPSCAISTPRAVFIANKQCDKVDICYKRPMNREFFSSRMKHARSSYQTALKSNRNIRGGMKDHIYPTTLFDMAERKFMQPDPYMHSSYDFYFTGGNLCATPNKGHVIHTGGEKLQEIFYSKFPEDECGELDYLHQVASNKMTENCEIFEARPLITSIDNNRQNCFILRQQNLITLNCTTDNNKIKTITQFRSKSTPFISFAQSDRDINNLVITTMKQHIRLYDLNNSVPALVKLFEMQPNSTNISWNTVKPWRENTFLYADQKQLFMIDIRTSPQQWMSEITFDSNNFHCDHISAVLPSSFNNLFYVATNHKLTCMDIRRVGKESLSTPDSAICNWSHQLSHAPLMIDTFRLRQSEFIALSSPIAGDLHICELSRERNVNNISLDSNSYVPKHIYKSPCLPYQPPTLLEAYESARFAGKCLKLEAGLEERLKCCTSGMKFINTSLQNVESGIGLLLTSNSNGDVFAHTLSKRDKTEKEERCNSKSIEIITEFERKLCEQSNMALNYTEIKNMKGLRKVFLCESLSKTKKEEDDLENESLDDLAPENIATNPQKKIRPKRKYLGRWQKSFSTLKSYKDALVADLLSIWDIELEDEHYVNLKKLNSAKTEPSVKVENWLKQHIEINTPPMLSIPPQVNSMYVDNDTSNIFDGTIAQTQSTTFDFENVPQSTQIFENSMNASTNFPTSFAIQMNNETNTTAIEKTKNKKKNKKYIKGF